MDKKITRLAGIEFSIKAELALIIGLVLTMLLGYPNVSTVPVAAILVFWSNRSLRGSVEYFGMRVRLQFVFAVADYLAVMLFRHFFPAVPDWIALIILGSIIVPLFLKLYYRHKSFMPLNITPILSNMIILAGLFGTAAYGYQRVLWTFFGCLLGVVLAFLIPGSGKLMTVKASLTEISGRAICELWDCVDRESFGVFSDYMQNVAPDASTELRSVDAYYATVKKDHSKAVKFPMRLIPLRLFTAKFKKYEKDVPRLGAMLAAANSQQLLLSYIHRSGRSLNALPPESRSVFLDKLSDVLELHGQALKSYSAGTATTFLPPSACSMLASGETEVVFASILLDYEEKVRAFAGSLVS